MMLEFDSNPRTEKYVTNLQFLLKNGNFIGYIFLRLNSNTVMLELILWQPATMSGESNRHIKA